MHWNGLLTNAAREESVKPWRGIATETLPSDIKKQLKPHWQNWVVVNPEYARYRSSGEEVRIFVIDRKGARQVQSLSETEIGQRHYVLRRRKPARKLMGGGGAAAAGPVEADPVEQEVQQLRSRSYVRIETPKNHSKFQAGKAPLQGDGPYTLKVDGTYSNGDGLTLHWENLDTGSKGQSEVESYPNRVGEPWKGEICGLEQGSHRISVRNAQGDSHQVRIEIRPGTIPVAEILYQPSSKTFYLLTEEEYPAFLKDIEEFDAVEKVRVLKRQFQKLQRFLDRFDHLPKPKLHAKAIQDNGIADV